MKKQHKYISILLFYLLVITSVSVQAGSLKKQIKVLNDEFKEHTFTSLNRLIFKSKYHVSKNGDTWGADKGQGKISFLTVKGAVAFNEGDTADLVWIKQKSDNEIMVRMFCCGNRKRSLRTTAHVDLYIHSENDFESDEINKQMIATAVSGFFTVEGFDDSKALDVLNNLNQNLQSSSRNNQYEAKDTVNSLTVNVTPQTLSVGESTILAMTFSIGSKDSNPVLVEETRILSYQGNVLPGYPVKKSNQRKKGEFTTQISQIIPENASKGVYQYKAEVCVSGDCISKQVDFIVK